MQQLDLALDSFSLENAKLKETSKLSLEQQVKRMNKLFEEEKQLLDCKQEEQSTSSEPKSSEKEAKREEGSDYYAIAEDEDSNY